MEKCKKGLIKVPFCILANYMAAAKCSKVLTALFGELAVFLGKSQS